MKAILIAEKPSLMREIRATYMEHRNEIPFEIDFLSQAGHLLGLKLPSEIDPETYGKWKMENFPIDVPYEYKVNSGKMDMLRSIREAVRGNRYDFVIHAGDPDQEGELLVNLVLHYVGNTLPIKRFWVNAQTHSEILNALLHMKDDSEYDNIYKAALVRQHADYQFGMNITGVATLKLGELFKLGRVKAPIIKMIVDRENAIRNYVEKRTWKRAFNWNECLFVDETEYETEKDALDNIPTCDNAVVSAVKDETKNRKAPKLYKLSTLQTDAYSKLGYSGAQTLEYLQHLYEAQLVSYPRTNCEYISSAVDLGSLIRAVAPTYGYSYGDFAERIEQVRRDSTYVNDRAIASEGHTAVIPTGQGSLSSVGQREQALYELIIRRFLAIFAEPKRVRSLTVTAYIDGNEKYGEYIFKETTDISAGFELVLNPRYEVRTGKGLSFNKGQVLCPISPVAKECVTKPPVRYNDGSIIKALTEIEFKKGDEKILYNIGTQATRAAIIEECIACGYFTKEKGAFVPTQKAERVVEELGDISLFDPTTSAKWEALLEQIRHGEKNASSVEGALLKECVEATENIKARNIKKAAYSKEQGNTSVLGKCPNCGANIVSGKFGAYCTEKCGMQVNKAMGKTLSSSQIKSVLAGKKILLKGLTSKAGKKYDAYLIPVGTEPFSYKGADGSQKNGVGFKFQMEFESSKK